MSLKSNLQWFHVFKERILNGDLHDINASAFMVYMVIKAHVNHKSGVSFPSVKRISELTGLSKETVLRGLTALEENNWLAKKKIGKRNQYNLTEKFSISSEEVDDMAVAHMDYIPGMVSVLTKQIKDSLETGSLSKLNGNKNIQVIVQINLPDAQGQINTDESTGFLQKAEDGGHIENFAQRTIKKISQAKKLGKSFAELRSVKTKA